MADFRLRIGFAKTGSAIWLSHLEIVRAMERCIRRSGLPYAISQGFSPHMKHSLSAALPVGTGSTSEYMDVELESLVSPQRALHLLQAAQHKYLPVLSASYAAKDEPSLQVYFNFATYLVKIDDPDGVIVPELLQRIQTAGEIIVAKKGKAKTYDLDSYVIGAEILTKGSSSDSHSSSDAGEDDTESTNTLILSLLSRPEGSIRPEVLLSTLAKPDVNLNITSLTRINLEHREL